MVAAGILGHVVVSLVRDDTGDHEDLAWERLTERAAK